MLSRHYVQTLTSSQVETLFTVFEELKCHAIDMQTGKRVDCIDREWPPVPESGFPMKASKKKGSLVPKVDEFCQQGK